MGILKRFFDRLVHWFQVISDWLLVLLGLALAAVALRSVDVIFARWTLILLGGLLVASGLWFRHRRIRRQRNSGG